MLRIHYLTSVQAADRLGLSQSQVNRLAARGDLRAVKVAGVWMIDPAAVERYASERQAS